ncbi:MAG: hypothetical protein EPO10_12915 [Reyranella sp.]|uniref:hypothetical protein n=1 Tax=Reyranella sp. TaxID=1929291 RepID=UPI0011F798E1|nr:hypothetical protein [Reyranella sp.]TAJ96559.1 MAG: hypothetical protein EPO41_05875 [Reyranella sp.]TBR28457.1 MAG: hypothetical protein EPO10_12915 [Reyranella sp.]
MLRIKPFVMGHLVSAVLVGAGAGAFLDVRASLYFALGLLAGAVVSSFVCQWKPGVEAPAWRLYLVALLANPILLVSLVFMALDWECVVGLRRGWNCIAAAMAIVAASLCFLPPLGGVAWRGWKRHRARPR